MAPKSGGFSLMCHRSTLPQYHEFTSGQQSMVDRLDQPGFPADCAAYASLLRSCGNAKALSDGKRVHDHIIKSGLEENTFLRNWLIQMYGNCGCLEIANGLFAYMHRRDRFSWNFMIKAYAQQGHVEEALQQFNHMQREGLIPDQFVLVSILSACTSPTVLAEGRRLHAILVFTEATSDAVVGTALVNMYGKCGKLDDAQRVFAKISDRDLVSWNAMIAVYAQLGQGTDAFRLYEQMQERDLMPDKFTFVTILSACTSQAALAEGRLVHSCIAGSALESDVAVGNALVDMYGKGGCIEDARKIFDKMPEQDLLLWTAMIAAYAQHDCSHDALQLLDCMQWEGLLPDKVTFVSILSAFASPAALAEGKRMHARIVSTGFASDTVVGNAILNMYVKCGSVEEARQIFDKMPRREVASWTAMIAAYSQHGQEKYALELVAQMQLEGVGQDKVVFIIILSACASQATLVEGKWMHACIISSGFESDIEVGNAVINMYGKCGYLEDALITLEKMCKWDDITFVSILSACANQASLAEGKWVHACIVCYGFELDDVVGNALLNMYGKCGSLEDARLIFDKIPQQNVALWNAMIGAYAQNGQGEDALQVFDQMQHEGVTPDDITFVSVLSACSHAGLVDEGSQHFVSMHQNHGITPEVDHYNCMIDLLARVGRLDDAEDVIYKMPLQPTSVSWMTLVGACRNQADVERGERAAVRAFELDPGNTAPYVTLSNIYAAVGREDDAAKVMQKLKDLGLKKQTAGDNMIDFEDWMQSFQVDHSDPLLEDFAESA